MSTSSTRKTATNPRDAKKDPSVPRDRDTDGTPGVGRNSPPAAVDANILDEDYTDREKPLVAGSPEARALHDRPPPAKGELGVGTAGDSGRPVKPGIHGKPLPPRGNM